MVALTPAPSQVGAVMRLIQGAAVGGGSLLMGDATCFNLARARLEPQPDHRCSRRSSSRIGALGDGCTVAGLHAPHHFVKGVSGVR